MKSYMIIGLTGSIASGKSTVSKMLQDMGFFIIDADIVAREVVELGSDTLQEIQNQFGNEVLHIDGTLNREVLGSMIFHQPAKRKQLNDIMHPAIRKEMFKQRDELTTKGIETFFMDIPLLFESHLQHLVEKILVVSVTEDVQLERLMSRNNISKEEAEARIKSQLPLSKKEKGADAVIYNNGSIGESKKQLETILKLWDVSPYNSEK